MNPDWSEMLQLNSKGFLANTEKPNKNWFNEYIPLNEQPVVSAAIFDAIRNKTVFELEHRVNMANGSVGWVYSHAIPIIDTSGEITEWFGAANDITERKEAELSLLESNRIVKQQLSEIEHKEKKLIRAKEALEQSQKKLNITLKNAKIGTWEWDLGTNEMRFDKRTEEIFGLEPGTFKGTISAFEDLVHEDDLPQVKQAAEKAREGNPEQTIYRTKPVDGSFNWLSASSVVIKDRQGNPRIISGVVFDISNLKAMTDQAIKRMYEELTRSNNDLQQFAYVASHDLQEPLRMVTSFTQLLQMQYSDKLDDRANEYINFAVDGSKRMYELVNGLLAYSRIQTKGVNFKEVDLEAILHQVQDNLLMLITEREAEIVADKLPLVYADSNQMIQLLQNLIENGIKFSKSRPLIRVSGQEKDGMHIISVRDNGIGIAPQYHDRIFMIFQRLHPQQEFKGTGIGLAVSRRIAERHGGKLWVESVPGEGSTFSFSIPQKMPG
jgi:PAS domain S-box-containing protein